MDELAERLKKVGSSAGKASQELSETISVIKKSEVKSELVEHDIATEAWREYDFGGRVYRINNPLKLFLRPNGTTHRVLGSDGKTVHCLPAPGISGCVLRWANKDSLENPCEF